MPKPPPNLLLCFDAFGTLFRPAPSAPQQYTDVARACGLSRFSDADVKRSFGAAIKRQSRENPNYGRTTNLGATRWWTNVRAPFLAFPIAWVAD